MVFTGHPQIHPCPLQDILAQDVLKSVTTNGVIKSAAVFPGRGSPAQGDCYTYLINDATSFFAACAVGTAQQVFPQDDHTCSLSLLAGNDQDAWAACSPECKCR